ncbi:MAG TPA: MscL family protein [Actinomycetes bacterium]
MVIGAAFAAVVQALVRDFLTPLIAAIFGKPDFSRLSFTLHHSVFHYGDLLNYLIAFLTVAVALFFFVVKPINRLMSLARHDKPADPSTRKCPACLSEIPLRARRCAYCTSNVQEIPNTEPAAQVNAAR